MDGSCEIHQMNCVVHYCCCCCYYCCGCWHIIIMGLAILVYIIKRWQNYTLNVILLLLSPLLFFVFKSCNYACCDLNHQTCGGRNYLILPTSNLSSPSSCFYFFCGGNLCVFVKFPQQVKNKRGRERFLIEKCLKYKK